MKLRYKLSLLFAFVILVGILPVSIYIVTTQEAERIETAKLRGAFQARLYAKNLFNILLMDAGDLRAARVDAQELSTIYKGLESEGLVRAHAWLVSQNKARDGAVVAGFARGDFSLPAFYKPETQEWATSSFSRLACSAPQAKGCLTFQADAGPTDRPAVLKVELVYSLAEVTQPIYKLRLFLYGTVALVILLMLVVAFFVARRITRPLSQLLTGVKNLESRTERHRVEIQSRDELGVLGEAFNRMGDTLERSYQELKEKNEELTKLDKMKDDFLAVTSHELKTPLNGIIGLAGTLLEGAAGPVADTLRRNIETIKHSGLRLSKLVDGILEASAIQNKKLQLDLRAVDLPDLFNEIAMVMRPNIEKKGLNFHVDIPHDIPHAMADRDKLAQILFNLIGNAVKFTDKGSITLRAALVGTALRLSIHDTGIGIAIEDQERIFKAFEQVESADTRHFGGLGLGLAVTKQLVELHNSHVKVQSVPTQGTEFYFVLQVAEPSAAKVSTSMSPPVAFKSRAINPLSELTEEADADSADESPDKKHRYNVLVVDDEPVNLQVLINQLSLYGYGVTVAESGSQALNFIENGPLPDAILLDVMMPGMSGYEVSRALRNKFTAYEVPILMLTAKNRNEDVVAGFAAGANDYIAKPIESEVLLARVKTAISLKESVREKDLLENLQRELAVAQKIQQALLPKEYPQCDRVRFAARFIPMTEVGGDFYDFMEHPDGVGVLIADVSGHGIPAALIASMVKMAFSLNRHLAPQPGALLSALNQMLCGKIETQFVTASYYFIDFQTNEIRFANAGHPPLFFLDKNAGNVKEEKPKGGFLGVFPEIQHADGVLPLSSGLRVLQLTDGILECRSAQDEEFGITKVRKLLEQTVALSTEEAADRLLSELRIFNPVDFEDDVTFVLIDYAV